MWGAPLVGAVLFIGVPLAILAARRAHRTLRALEHVGDLYVADCDGVLEIGIVAGDTTITAIVDAVNEQQLRHFLTRRYVEQAGRRVQARLSNVTDPWTEPN